MLIISDIEMKLLLGLTLLSFFSSLLPILLKPLWICFCRRSQDEKRLLEDLFNLKSEQQRISMKDNFASHAKLQRKINKLEDSLKELSQARLGQNLKMKLIITYALQSILAVIMFIVAFWYRGTPIVVFQQDLFPFQNLISYPTQIPNAISPHAWIILSRISFGSLLNPA